MPCHPTNTVLNNSNYEIHLLYATFLIKLRKLFSNFHTLSGFLGMPLQKWSYSPRNLSSMMQGTPGC